MSLIRAYQKIACTYWLNFCLNISPMDKDDWYFLSPYGAGDTYMVCVLAKAFKKKFKGKIHLIVKPSHKKIADLFKADIDECIVYKPSRFNPFKNFPQVILRGLEKGKISPVHPIHSKNGRALLDRMNEHEINFFEVYKNFFELEDAVPSIPVIPEEAAKSAEKRFNELGLEKGKTVLLAPEAFSIKGVENVFWESLSKELQNKGYKTYFNNINSDLSFAELIPFADLCGNVVSIRSGICDVLNSTNANMFVLYNDLATYSSYSLKSLFGHENINEYVCENLSLNEIQQEILNKL